MSEFEDFTICLDKLAQSVVKLLCEKKLKIGTAESCTGGMLSQYITSVAGSSEVFEMGICSYSNRIKTQELGVPEAFIESFGVVSEQVASAMAKAVAQKASADIGVGITGVAGPGGGTKEKPVGTVFVAVCFGEKLVVKNLSLNENSDRDTIRKLTVISAFRMILDII